MRNRGSAIGLAVLAATVAMCGLVPAVSGAVVLTTWDDGTADGWTLPNNSAGRWEVVPTGGNPNGYVRFYDLQVTTVTYLRASNAYLGDYSSLGPDARFEFDIRTESPAVVGATIYMTGPGGTYIHTTPIPSATWTHYVLPLQQSSWIYSGGSWSGLLANVTDVHILGDIATGYNQGELALDNFALVPEPVTLALLALGGLVLRRRFI